MNAIVVLMDVTVLLGTDTVDAGAAGDELEENKPSVSTADSEGSLPASEGTSENAATQSDDGGAHCMKSDMGNIVAQETGKWKLSVRYI